MFKMADLNSQAWPRFAWAILCILTACLALHFLAKDSVLAAEQAVPEPAASGENTQFYEEADDKDDLVMPAGQLAGIAPCEIQSEFFNAENHEKLANSPVLPPPRP